jgi:HK97 gp10 family phage protein
VKLEIDTEHTDAALRRLLDSVTGEEQKQALRKAAMLVERNMKQKLTANGRHKKGTPTPSAPGTPPAIVTGALRRSVKTSPVQQGFKGYRIMIGPTMVYARVQELGGGPRNLPARPYVRPTMEESKDEVRKLFIDELRSVVDRSGR